jgi:hypothetical protein
VARAWTLCSWSKPPFFSGMTRLEGSAVFTFASGRPAGRRGGGLPGGLVVCAGLGQGLPGA